jgi:hypothetical protein
LALGAEPAAKAPVPYQWSVVTDSALSLKAGVETKAPRTGEALTLTARITQDGAPLNLPATVWVRWARPLQAVGNWLAASGVSPEELGRVPETRGGETLSPLLRKIVFLKEFRKKPFAGQVAIDAVRLYDDGTHGDAAAGDGVYTGRFEGTTVAGTYIFDVQASGRTPGGTPFERSVHIERQIAVKADRISAAVDRLPAESRDFDVFEITLRPADVYGNLLGPDRQHLILWEATAGEFPAPAVDHLNGTYSRRLKLEAGLQPGSVDLAFVIGDSSFRLNLGKALQPRSPVPAGWLVLLLFILLAILLRLLKGSGR